MLKKLLLSLGLLACSIAGAQDVPIVIIKDTPVALPGAPVLKQWWRQAVLPAKVNLLIAAPGGVNSNTTLTGVNTNPQPNALVITPCPSGQVELGGLCACPLGSSWNAAASSCDGPPTCNSASISSVWNANATQLQTTIGGVSGLTTAVYIPSWGLLNGQNDIVWVPATNLGGGTWRGSFDATVVNEPGQYAAHVYLSSVAYPGPPGTFCAAAVTNRPVSCVAATSCPGGTAWNGSQCTGSFTNCVGNPTATQGYTWYNLNSAFVGSAICPQTGTGVIAASCGTCPATQSWNGASCVCIAPLVWNGATCACPSGTMFNSGANTCDGPPTIPTLTASLASMCAGQGNVFAWTTAGANAASIACTNGLNVGAGLNSSTTQVFNTPGTNSCTITAVNTGTGQGITRAVSFTVNTVPAAGTASVNPVTVTAGVNATWTWSLGAGTSYLINCPTLGLVDSPILQSNTIAWGATFPNGTHTCQFTSVNACGSSPAASASLTVNACPAITFPITVNSAASANVTAGTVLLWDWNASGGTGLTNTVTWSGAFAGSGSTGITASSYSWGSAGWPNGSTNFSFTVTNSCGSTLTKVVPVTINACPAVTGNASVSPTNPNSSQTAYWTWGFTGGTIASVTRNCFGATTIGSTAMPFTGTNVPFGAAGLAIGTTYCQFTATNTCGQSATITPSVTVSNPVSPCPINCVGVTGASDAVWNAGAQTCDHSNTTCPPGKTLVAGGAGLNYWTINTAAPGPSACPVSSGELTKTLPNCILSNTFLCQDNSLQINAAACPKCPNGSQVAPWGLCVSYLQGCAAVGPVNIVVNPGVITWIASSAGTNCISQPNYSQSYTQQFRNGVSYWAASSAVVISGSSAGVLTPTQAQTFHWPLSCDILSNCSPF